MLVSLPDVSPYILIAIFITTPKFDVSAWMPTADEDLSHMLYTDTSFLYLKILRNKLFMISESNFAKMDPKNEGKGEKEKPKKSANERLVRISNTI